MQAVHERVKKRLGSVGLSGAMALAAAWASGPAAAPVTALASTGVTPTVVHAVPADFKAGTDSARAPLDTSFSHYIQPKPETARLTGGGGSSSKSAEGGGVGPKAGVWSSSNWPGVNFADVSVSGFRGPTPPDPNGVVGPNNYMEAVNGKFAVYDRMGHQLAAASDDYFTGRNRQTPQRFMSDPTVNYDPRTNRWFYQMASFNRGPGPDCPSGRAACNFEIDFGWSTTSDPSNLDGQLPQQPAWCRYVYPFSATILPDYTKTAIDDNWIYFGSNLFDFTTPGSTPFLSANVTIFPKPTTSAVITSCPALTGFSFGSGASPLLHPGGEQIVTIKPVDSFSTSQGAGASAYLVSARYPCFGVGPGFARNQIGVMHIGGTTAAPTFVYDGLQTVNTYSCPPNVPEPNSRLIDTLDGRMAQGAAIPDPSNGGKEGLWVAHTVALGAGADNIAIQWYEILMPVAAGSSPNTPSLAQQGSVGGGTPAGIGKFTFAWNSGIAPAKAGNEGVLTYNWAEAVDMTGNNTTRTQLRAASHDPSMPSGAMSLPVTVANSLDDPVDFSCPTPAPGSTATCRWGDYAGASTDPNDNHVVWATGMWTGLRHLDPGGSGTNMAQWATQNFAITAAASGATTSGPYVGVSPNRILDTRTTAKIPANSTLDVQVTGTAGVPASGVGAVAVNATGLNATQPTYVTVYPTGINPRPLASTVNFGPGQQVAALTEVPVGTGGKITVYNSQGSVDLLLDVQGYTMSSLQTNTAGLYKPLAAPARILDTRTGTPFGAIAANTTQTLAVSSFLPDSRASAVILNATAINGAAPGYLTLYPTGAATPPTASNVNFPAGKNVPNRVMVQLGTGPSAGKINIYNGSTAAIDVALDLSGWFTDGTDPAATGATFHPLSPARILDSRSASAIGPYSSPFAPGSWRWVQVAGMGTVPVSGASSMVGTLTAVNATTGTYLTAHPSDQALPNASDLNPGPGDTLANMIVVRLGSGDQAIYVYNNLGFVDVLIDVTGYYG